MFIFYLVFLNIMKTVEEIKIYHSNSPTRQNIRREPTTEVDNRSKTSGNIVDYGHKKIKKWADIIVNQTIGI